MVKRYFVGTSFFVEAIHAQMIIRSVHNWVGRVGVHESASINNPLVPISFEMDKKSKQLFFLFFFIHSSS